jgi:tetratricopeptide (TPR) repeat protein
MDRVRTTHVPFSPAIGFLVAVLLLAKSLPTHAGIYDPTVPNPWPKDRIEEYPLDYSWRLPIDDLVSFWDLTRQLREMANPKSTVHAEMLRRVQVLRSRPSDTLSAGEAAALGAYLYYLREEQGAIQTLERANRRHPRDFFIQANLATVYQSMGNFDLAHRYREEAVNLAPDPLRERELFHLKWLTIRQRVAPAQRERERFLVLDPLFETRFVGADGKWSPGLGLPRTEYEKLPADAMLLVQSLLLAYPADAKLILLFAELANYHHDRKPPSIAAAYFAVDWAVVDGQQTQLDLRERRIALRDSYQAELQQAPPPPPESTPDADAETIGRLTWSDFIAKLEFHEWVVIGLGGTLFLLFLVLQLRRMWIP